MSEVIVERVWTTAPGFPALAVVTSMGHRCGYVGVPGDHPLYGVDYSQECECLTFPADEEVGNRGVIPLLVGNRTAPDVVFNVHGGLTFSGRRDSIADVDSAYWFFGFDCAHAGDAPDPAYAPLSERYGWTGGVVRSLPYVEQECESLAEQLISRIKE